jgi:hypothetical protein
LVKGTGSVQEAGGLCLSPSLEIEKGLAPNYASSVDRDLTPACAAQIRNPMARSQDEASGAVGYRYAARRLAVDWVVGYTAYHLEVDRAAGYTVHHLELGGGHRELGRVTVDDEAAHCTGVLHPVLVREPRPCTTVLPITPLLTRPRA